MSDDYVRRAIAAYFKYSSPMGTPQQPSQGDSGFQKVGDLEYVVLRNVNGILAVYRINNQGNLKRLVRYPKALEND